MSDKEQDIRIHIGDSIKAGEDAGEAARTHDDAGGRCCDEPERHARRPPMRHNATAWRLGFAYGYNDYALNGTQVEWLIDALLEAKADGAIEFAGEHLGRTALLGESSEVAARTVLSRYAPKDTEA